MWRTAVLVFLLLTMDMHVSSAADKDQESAAKTTKPEKNVQTEEREAVASIPATKPEKNVQTEEREAVASIPATKPEKNVQTEEREAVASIPATKPVKNVQTEEREAVASIPATKPEKNVQTEEREAVASIPATKPEKNVQTEEREAVASIPANNLASVPSPGKVLVVPMDGSHWVGVKALAQELGKRGHKVTVVIPEVSIRMGPGKHYDTITHPVPYDKEFLDELMSSNKFLFDKSSKTFIEKMKNIFSHMQKLRELIHITAEQLLFNETIISHLEKEGYDVVITDPMVPTGALIAHKLGLPIINVLRGIPCHLDMQAAGCPSPPSYVPRFFTGNTDKMNFKERTINTVVAFLEPLLCRVLYQHFDTMAYQFLGKEVGVAEVLSDSALWLLRLDFAFELPRPLMPNMILVGGINCHMRNPLPKELESWVDGEHGFIVFTLGSMVSDMPEDTTLIFLEAFRQIPQKVIWRFDGKLPDNIPENVKMMKWVPQNDLLAHPGVRAFITHGGSHGLFEGLCHAVPMLMVPVAGDQPDNSKRLASKGVGVVLDLFEVTTESLLEGLNEVVNNTRYKENVQKLSALHNDRPIDPVDLSIYWTEFVMRHKGAKHLKAAVHDLNWIQYHCLDVIAFLAAVVLVTVIVILKCCKMCFRKVTGKKKQD